TEITPPDFVIRPGKACADRVAEISTDPALPAQAEFSTEKVYLSPVLGSYRSSHGNRYVSRSFDQHVGSPVIEQFHCGRKAVVQESCINTKILLQVITPG